MGNPGSITRMRSGVRTVSGLLAMGFILIFTSGIVDILALNMRWPLLTITGLLPGYGWQKGHGRTIIWP